MLALDSLILDLMFQKGATIQPDVIIDALGGEDAVAERKIIDPDLQDPRFEMELSPSMPFRRRGERRLMIIDDSVAPMRKNPRTDPVIPIDLRGERDRLITICEGQQIRIGRLSALGSWGDGVLVVRSARDLRGIALLPWVLDPSVDVDGTKRATPLTQQDFEAKLMAFEKRLEELDDEAILASIGDAATVERRGDLIIVDLLEEDGSWDLRKSRELEQRLAAVDKFSLIPGAPAFAGTAERAKPAAKPAPAVKPAAQAEPAVPEKPVSPLGLAELDGKPLLIFPPERFDLDIAAALGKRDFDAVIRRGDNVPGSVRDRIQRDGAHFVAPLEFLSEVFLDGKPLSRADLDKQATTIADGVRTLAVHCPRFGPVVLIDTGSRGRFICSAIDHASDVLALI